MSAPPDRIIARLYPNGIVGAHTIDRPRTFEREKYSEYLLRDGPTMQAAIAAARANAIREARGIAYSLAQANHEAGLSDMKCGALEVVDALTGLLPPGADRMTRTAKTDEEEWTLPGWGDRHEVMTKGGRSFSGGSFYAELSVKWLAHRCSDGVWRELIKVDHDPWFPLSRIARRHVWKRIPNPEPPA